MRKFGTGIKLLLLLSVAAFLLPFFAGCVDIEPDPDPPYPLHPYDYTYPSDEQAPEPWENPDDFPFLEITEPENGLFVQAGSQTVSGTYQGPELKSLTVNGKTINAAANFSTQITVEDTDVYLPITVTATTEDGISYIDEVTVLVGQPADPEALVQNAFALDLENRGLTAISGLLSTVLDGTDLLELFEKAMAKGEPKALFDLTEATLGNLDAAIESREEGLNIELMVSGLDIGLEILGQEGTIEIDGLLMQVLAEISATADNQLEIEIAGFDLSIADWDTSLPILPDNVEDILDTVIELLLPAIAELVVENMLPDLLNNLLAGLDLTIVSDGFSYSILPALVETNDRNMVIAMDTQVTITDDWKDDFQPEGFLSTASDAPTFEETTPVTDVPYGLGLALEDDMLNQLFYTLAASGTLDFELYEKDIDTEALSILFFSFEAINPAKKVIIKFAPSVAPIVWASPLTEKAYMAVPGYTATIYIARGDEGLWEAMSVAVDIFAPLAVDFDENGEVNLKLGDADIGVRILHNAIGQKNTERLNGVMEELLSGVIAELMTTLDESLSLGAIDLMGMDVSLADLAAFGPAGDYVGLFIDLEFMK